MLRKTIVLVALTGMLALSAVGCGSPTASSSASSSTASPSAQSSSESAAAIASSSASSAQIESSSSAENQKATGLQNALDGKFDSAIFYSKVRNDNTGRWRSYVYDSNIAPQDFALEYYRAYFSDDGEIHALVNLRAQTTAKVSVVGTDLDVTVQEYVKGEEHDANLLFSGDVTAEYFVNKETGEIEQVR